MRPMPRYVIERDFGHVDDEEMLEIAVLSKLAGIEQFPDITWEHSHVCTDDSGAIKSFCVYAAPNEERLREHAIRMGRHTVARVYEIAGDITPDEIKV
jgi:hypothetical protein